jgi:hypothetical protein
LRFDDDFDFGDLAVRYREGDGGARPAAGGPGGARGAIYHRELDRPGAGEDFGDGAPAPHFRCELPGAGSLVAAAGFDSGGVRAQDDFGVEQFE